MAGGAAALKVEVPSVAEEVVVLFCHTRARQRAKNIAIAFKTHIATSAATSCSAATSATITTTVTATIPAAAEPSLFKELAHVDI